jgi:8-oxo-dGTP pyrophosphatase MutT (NUDIX family)
MLISHAMRNRITERLRGLFGAVPPRIQVAALPWRITDENGLEILLVTSRGSKRWILPKGWPEGKESLREAAMREAEEEAGITGAVSTTELGSYYYGKRLATGLERRCQVLVFPLEVKKIADKWPERKRRARQWFDPETAASMVQERDLAELIAAFGVNPRQFAA